MKANKLIRTFHCPYCAKILNVEIKNFYAITRVICGFCDKDFIILNGRTVAMLTDKQIEELRKNDTLLLKSQRKKKLDIIKNSILEGKKDSYIEELIKQQTNNSQ